MPESALRLGIAAPVALIGLSCREVQPPFVVAAPTAVESAPYVSDAGPRPIGSIPVWGGTLAAKGTRLVAADPDGDRVVIVDTATRRFERAVDLGPGSAPFRVAIDDAGDRAYVTLRGTGALAELALPTGAVTRIEPVCAEVRGVDVSHDGTVYVVCADGELVVDRGAGVVERIPVGRDLRDVMVRGDAIWVSEFRGGGAWTLQAADLSAAPSFSFRELAVVWRMVRPRQEADEVGFLGVRATTADLNRGAALIGTTRPSYLSSGNLCSTISTNTLVLGELEHRVESTLLVDADRFDERIAMVSAAGGAAPAVYVAHAADDGCMPLDQAIHPEMPGHAVATVFDGEGRLAVQFQQPFGLWIAELPDPPAPQDAVYRADAVDVGPVADADPSTRRGFDLFHSDTPARQACASCHPEGQDDGHVWSFVDAEGHAQPRRTMTLAGGVASRAPYHWDGDLPTFSSLLLETFTTGMAGPPLGWDDQEALLGWLEGLRTVRYATATATAAEIARGKTLFEDPHIGCASCHTGPAFTDDRVWDVRAFDGDGPVKTPSLLGVSGRSRLMHDACAFDLKDRFLGQDTCTGAEGDDLAPGEMLHGDTRDLDYADVDALVAYLQTL